MKPRIAAAAVSIGMLAIAGTASAAHDFGAGPSSLGAAFPLEATIPVLCGGIAN